MNLLCKIGLHKWVHCQEDDFWIRWPYVICRKCFTMKLDVEGNELAVLRGSQESLKTKRIKALTFEFGSGNINSRTFFHDFWDVLKGYGYTIKRICPGGILLEIAEYYEDLEHFRGVTNYLAIAES